MCLYSRKKTPTIAEKDIHVYKVVDTNGGSPYHKRYVYSKSRVNEPNGKECILSHEGFFSTHYEIHGGFLHAYTTEHDAVDLMKMFNDGRYTYDGESTCKREFMVAKMHIPAGTKYFVSEDESEVCSKSLIWD